MIWADLIDLERHFIEATILILLRASHGGENFILQMFQLFIGNKLIFYV